jgi:hypothetical protein
VKIIRIIYTLRMMFLPIRRGPKRNWFGPDKLICTILIICSLLVVLQVWFGLFWIFVLGTQTFLRNLLTRLTQFYPCLPKGEKIYGHV